VVRAPHSLANDHDRRTSARAQSSGRNKRDPRSKQHHVDQLEYAGVEVDPDGDRE
jgi:hypothetical protein